MLSSFIIIFISYYFIILLNSFSSIISYFIIIISYYLFWLFLHCHYDYFHFATIDFHYILDISLLASLHYAIHRHWMASHWGQHHPIPLSIIYQSFFILYYYFSFLALHSYDRHFTTLASFLILIAIRFSLSSIHFQLILHDIGQGSDFQISHYLSSHIIIFIISLLHSLFLAFIRFH